MSRFVRFALFLCLGVLSTAALAQQPDTSDAAPIPPAILNAKTIFLSNAGADSGLFPSPFSGTVDRPYNQLFAALQQWGKYDLVGDPAQADLVFELQLTAPNGPSNPNKQSGASDPLPMFRLVLYDRPTHYVLWAVTESVAAANRQTTHDRNFDDALDNLLRDLKNLSNNAGAVPPKPSRYRFSTGPIHR